MYLSPLVLDSKMKERDGYMKCPHGVPLWYVSEALISWKWFSSLWESGYSWFWFFICVLSSVLEFSFWVAEVRGRKEFQKKSFSRLLHFSFYSGECLGFYQRIRKVSKMEGESSLFGNCLTNSGPAGYRWYPAGYELCPAGFGWYPAGWLSPSLLSWNPTGFVYIQPTSGRCCSQHPARHCLATSGSLLRPKIRVRVLSWHQINFALIGQGDWGKFSP